MKPKDLFLIIVGMLLVIILFQNTPVVSFQFLVWKISCSRIFLILLGMLIGFTFGLVVKKR